MLRLLSVLTLYTFFAAALPAVSSAEELPKTDITDAPDFVPNYGYTMSFVRLPDMEDNEAVLRIKQPLSVSGCVEVTTPEPKVELIGPSAKVIISAPIIKFNDDPQYGNNTCKRSSPTVISDVIFDRDELIERKIEKSCSPAPAA